MRLSNFVARCPFVASPLKGSKFIEIRRVANFLIEHTIEL